MTIKKILRPLLVLVTLLLTSCGKSVPDYARLVPDDAEVVARLDVRQLAAKSGFGRGGGMGQRVSALLKERLTDKTQKVLAAIIHSPIKAGLDLRDPVLVYWREGGQSMGYAGTVFDADDVASLLNTLVDEFGGERVTAVGSHRYACLRGLLVVFCDDWFVVESRAPEQSCRQQVQTVVGRYQRSQPAITDNAAFRRLFAYNGVAQVLVRGPRLYEVNSLVAQALTATGIDFHRADVVVDLAMERAAAIATAEVVPAERDRETMTAKIDALMGGSKHGLCLRLSYESLCRLLADQPFYDSYQADLAGQLVQYVELKYEGDNRVCLRIGTRDVTKNALESAIALVRKEIGL